MVDMRVLGRIGFGVVLALELASAVAGEVVAVKYRGTVDLASFDCKWTSGSSVVSRICYDKAESYVVVSLKGTYYHYCEVPPTVVSSWRSAESLGRFYNAQVKGRFDCRIHKVPQYAR